MTDVDLAFERFVAANPIMDPDEFVAHLDLPAETPPLTESQASKRRGPRIRRTWVAAASFAVVLAAAVVLISVRPGGQVATGDSAIEVVEAFFGRWNANESTAAMALVDLEVSVNLGAQSWSDLRSLMQWSMEFDGSMEVDCVPDADEHTLVTCDWAFRTALTDALGLEPAQARPFRVADGRIVSIATPNYGALERTLADHAREADPVGFAAECASEPGTASSVYGFPFTTRCGRYFATLEAAAIAALEP